jgi:hypothetical protein
VGPKPEPARLALSSARSFGGDRRSDLDVGGPSEPFGGVDPAVPSDLPVPIFEFVLSPELLEMKKLVAAIALLCEYRPSS